MNYVQGHVQELIEVKYFYPKVAMNLRLENTDGGDDQEDDGCSS